MHKMFLATFVTHTTLNIQIISNIPFYTTTELITVTVSDRSLTVQSPIRITVLLQSCIRPVLNIATTRRIIHFVIFFIIIPILTSWKQIHASQWVQQETSRSLILYILICKLGCKINMNTFERIKSYFRIQIMTTIIV